jgi:competence protein ComEC
MRQLHFLNVGDGDCTWIRHGNGNNTVIDICKGNADIDTTTDKFVYELLEEKAQLAKGISGNFKQKKFPVNPIKYLQSFGVTDIFRFIATHPDMDHLDGLRKFFDTFQPINFWDTDNTKEIESFDEARYSEDDWNFYRGLRSGANPAGAKRLVLYSGAQGQHYNMDEESKPGANGLYILAPTKEIVQDANACGDYNDCSYVLLWRVGDFKVVIGGDSHDVSWEHILEAHPDVKNVDLLIAPHHGRDSERSYDFLDVLKPQLTLFGVARSEHLGYQAWSSRGLEIMTNNQGNCFVIDFPDDKARMDVHCTYKGFADAYCQNAYGKSTFVDEALKSWFLRSYFPRVIKSVAA